MIWDWMHSRCVEWNNERNPMATSLVLVQRGREVCRRGCCYQWKLDSAAAANIPSSHGTRILTFNLTDSRSSASFNQFLSLLSFRGDARFEIPRFSRVRNVDSLEKFYLRRIFLISLVHNFLFVSKTTCSKRSNWRLESV